MKYHEYVMKYSGDIMKYREYITKYFGDIMNTVSMKNRGFIIVQYYEFTEYCEYQSHFLTRYIRIFHKIFRDIRKYFEIPRKSYESIDAIITDIFEAPPDRTTLPSIVDLRHYLLTENDDRWRRCTLYSTVESLRINHGSNIIYGLNMIQGLNKILG